MDVARGARIEQPGLGRRELPAVVRALPLLLLPGAWLGVFYLIPLGLLLLHSVWSTDQVNMVIVHQFTLSSYSSLLGDPMFRNVALRTLLMALGVTLVDAILAFPIAYLIAFRLRRAKTLAFLLVLVPLWSSYLL